VKIPVTFAAQNRRVEVKPGTPILKAARQAGLPLESDCGGKGRCGKCKVVVRRGVTPLSPLEREYLTQTEVKGKVRLACQALVVAPCSVSLPVAPSGREHILEGGISHSVRFLPHLRKFFVNLTANDLRRPDTVEAIIIALLGRQGIQKAAVSFSALKSLSSLFAGSQGGMTALVRNGEVLGFEPGDTRANLYGLAVDIGTTTVVGYLFDLRDGSFLGVDSALNRQAEHGADVISRIDYAINAPRGLSELQDRVVGTINRIIENLCTFAGITGVDLYHLVVVGNPTMNHLFLGISPWLFSRSPYNPLTTNPLVVPASCFRLKMNPGAQVSTLPLISGFIGSDTVGMVLSTGLHRSRTPKMALDIGTNGEIVLTDGTEMVACSCAAGPAFEGAQIQCGMRGASGAVDRVDLAGDAIHYHVIDEAPPQGICGSGLVDAVAAMLQAGLITSDGRLLTREEIPNSPLARFLTRQKYNQFVLTPHTTARGSRQVVITQKDIRELQLAKAAMMAGIRILLDKLGLKETDIREVCLAGAFGNYVRPQSAVAIGLLPVFPNARVIQVGNAAGSGGKMALLSPRAVREAVRIARRINYVELAKVPHFQTEFLKGMVFPQ
jgi:uncharacterized 2Fe-2S/4Fe-4S cluster protein (DUF4445 family)